MITPPSLEGSAGFRSIPALETTTEDQPERLRRLAETTAGLPDDIAQSIIADYDKDVAAGVAPHEAFQSVIAKAQESRQGSASAVGPLAEPLDPMNPLSVLNATSAFPAMAGEALQTVARPVTEELGPAGEVIDTTLGLAPLFAAGPTGALRGGMALPLAFRPMTPKAATGLAALAGVGGEVTEELGLGEGVGELTGPVVGPGLVNAARGSLALGANVIRETAAQGDDDVLNTIRSLSDEDKFALGQKVFQEQGRDAFLQVSHDLAAATAGDIQAAQRVVGQYFKENRGVLSRKATQLADLMDRLAGNTQGPSAGIIPQSADDLTKIAQEEKYLRGQGTAPIPEPPSPGRNWFTEALGLLGLPRTLMAGGDAGAITRQGQRNGWSNPKEWANAAKQGLAAFASEDAALASRAAVESDPWYKFARDVGLKIYDWGDGIAAGERVPGFDSLNESWLSQQATKIPWLNVGERAHATTLNALGMQVFDKYASAMWNAGIRSKSDYEALATVINHARGYGTGTITQNLSSLNIFFSARNMNSLWQSALDPITKSGALFAPSLRNRSLFAMTPRGLAAKNLAALVGGQTALLGLMGVTGAVTGEWSVDADPTSSDFGKLKVGNTRIDTLGGYGPIVRLVSRISTQASDATLGTELASEWTDWRNELVRFFRNKLGPAPGLIASAIVGEDYKGDPFSIGPELLAEMTLPMLVMSAYESVSGNEGAQQALAGLVVPAEFIGLGSSTYETPTEARNEAASAQFQGSYDDLSPIQQAQVDAQLGERLDEGSIPRSYWNAPDAAFAKLKTEQPEVFGEFEDLDAFREYLERRIRESAAANGQTLEEQDVTNARLKIERQFGLEEATKAYRLGAVAANPAIVEALQARYDSGESEFAPGKTYREIAALILENPAEAQRVLDALAAQGYR